MIDFLLIYADKEKIIPENVVHRFKDVFTDQVLFDVEHAYYIYPQDKKRMAVFFTDGSFNSHLSYSPQKDAIHFFDGSLFNGKQHITDITKMDSLPSYMKIGGNYCAGVFSEKGVNFVHETVLGIYNLFWSETKDFFAISNNPHLIATAIKEAEYPETNMMNFAYLVSAWGPATGDLGTAYKGVWRFPVNAGCVISEDNSVKFKTLTDELYVPKSPDEWEKSFKDTTEDLLTFVSAIEGKSWGNITGGMDSRTSLAIVLAANIQDKFDFSVSGLPENADVVAAKEIAKRCEIPLTYYDLSQKSNDIEAKAYIENIKFNLIKCCGSRVLAEIGTNKVKNKKKIEYPCTGLFGEYIRGPQTKKDFPLFDKIISKEFLNNDSIEYMKEKVSKFFDLSCNNPSYFSNFYIQLTNNPQFHGGLYNRGLISILANTSLHNLLHTNSLSLFFANNLNFRLIEHCCPKLLKIPFKKHKWDQINYVDRRDRDDFEKIMPLSNDSTNNSRIRSLQKLQYLKDYLFEPEEDIFSIFERKSYFDYIENNCDNLTSLSATKMMNLVTPTLWLKMLKSGEIHHTKQTPVSIPLSKDHLAIGTFPFSEKQYGSVSVTPKEVLQKNLLALTSPEITLRSHSEPVS